MNQTKHESHKKIDREANLEKRSNIDTPQTAPHSHEKNFHKSEKNHQNNKKIKSSFLSTKKNDPNSQDQLNRPIEHEIFVGKIPFDTTEKELYEIFSPCGKILGAKLLFNKDGKSKGRGFVKFSTEEGVKKAILLNDTLFREQRLKVDAVKNYDELFKEKNDKAIAKMKEFVPPENKFLGVKSTTLLVRNLDYSVTKDRLVDIFKNCKGFNDCRIILNNQGQNKGFGFIEFVDIESAESALELNGTLLAKKKFHLEFSAPRGLRTNKNEEDLKGGQEKSKVGIHTGEIVDL